MQKFVGSIFESYAAYLGHGVNCRGVMGAGIAKEFKNRFPDNYDLYRRECLDGRLNPGDVLVTPERENGDGRLRLITNFASQREPGQDADYKWLFSSLWSWAEQASEPQRLRKFGGIIAIPKIGCGIGGLEWSKAKNIIKAVEDSHGDIEFEVWYL